MGTMVSFPVSAVMCVYGFDGGWPSVFYVTGELDCRYVHLLVSFHCMVMLMWTLYANFTVVKGNLWKKVTSALEWLSWMGLLNTGAAGILWLIPYLLFVFDSPSTHPRISVKERFYIASNMELEEDQVTLPCSVVVAVCLCTNPVPFTGSNSMVSHLYLFGSLGDNCWQFLLLLGLVHFAYLYANILQGSTRTLLSKCDSCPLHLCHFIHLLTVFFI